MTPLGRALALGRSWIDEGETGTDVSGPRPFDGGSSIRYEFEAKPLSWKDSHVDQEEMVCRLLGSASWIVRTPNPIVEFVWYKEPCFTCSRSFITLPPRLLTTYLKGSNRCVFEDMATEISNYSVSSSPFSTLEKGEARYYMASGAPGSISDGYVRLKKE